MDYFDGILLYVEDSTKIVFIDTASGFYEIKHTAESIKSVYQFDHDKMIWRDENSSPYYLNISTRENIALNTEHEVNCLLAPYITPPQAETTTRAISFANTDYSNDVTFPLSEYPANPINYSNPFPTASRYFNNSNNYAATCDHKNGIRDCKNYGGHNQCFGFAIYAHDKYIHLYSAGKNTEGWATGDFVACANVYEYNGQIHVLVPTAYILENHCDVASDFFLGLHPGAYIRYGKYEDVSPENGAHSIVLVSANESGIWVYECNMDDKCGVYYTYYRYDQICDDKYDYIHNYVNHNFSGYTYENTNYHTFNCSNCDGYLRQAHTSETKSYVSLLQHKVSYNCCGGSVNKSHTQRTYRTYSALQHRVSFSCCGGTGYEAHTLNSFGECTRCGYNDDSSIVASKGTDKGLSTHE